MMDGAAIASRPSDSGPITSNVHSGLLRSRCSDISPPDDSPQVGLGDALRVGPAPDVLTDVERLRRNPARLGQEVSLLSPWLESSRSDTAARSTSMSSAPAPGSRIISLRVCPAIDADSRPRMRPSSAERRSESSRGGTCHSVRLGSVTRATMRPMRAFACPVCQNFTSFERDRCHLAAPRWACTCRVGR